MNDEKHHAAEEDELASADSVQDKPELTSPEEQSTTSNEEPSDEAPGKSVAEMARAFLADDEDESTGDDQSPEETEVALGDESPIEEIATSDLEVEASAAGKQDEEVSPVVEETPTVEEIEASDESSESVEETQGPVEDVANEELPDVSIEEGDVSPDQVEESLLVSYESPTGPEVTEPENEITAEEESSKEDVEEEVTSESEPEVEAQAEEVEEAQEPTIPTLELESEYAGTDSEEATNSIEVESTDQKAEEDVAITIEPEVEAQAEEADDSQKSTSQPLEVELEESSSESEDATDSTEEAS
ncbi:MAG: hypothetical protein JXQ96_22050, partial [Cyclobacteriaceae bacterium]